MKFQVRVNVFMQPELRLLYATVAHQFYPITAYQITAYMSILLTSSEMRAQILDITYMW